MKLNQPILTSWQKGTMASYIRRHHRFFKPASGGNRYASVSLYQFFFIMLPLFAGIFFLNSPWSLILVGFTFAHIVAAYVFVNVALEKR